MWKWLIMDKHNFFHNRQARFSRGFSVFTLDGMTALLIALMSVVFIIIFMLNQVPSNSIVQKGYLQSYADFASKNLVESPGVPLNWESLSSVSTIGLADNSSPRVFDTQKSNALDLLTEQEVKDAMQIGDLKIDLRITITNKSTSLLILETPSNSPPPSARESKRFMTNSNDELIEIKVQVWG